MRAAPPIGYNLTYSCPEGMVFDHDWFATPFVMMTCKVTRHQHEQPASQFLLYALYLLANFRMMEFLTSLTGTRFLVFSVSKLHR